MASSDSHHGLAKLALWIALAAGLLFAGVGAYDPYGVFHEAENKWGDFLLRVRGTIPGDPKLQIVAIDDFSIGAIGPFPWKRGVYGQIIRKLDHLGIKAIGFDVLFLDPRPDDRAGDKAMVDATKESGRVIHLENIEHLGGEGVVANLPQLPHLEQNAAMLAHPSVEGDIDPDGMLRHVVLWDDAMNPPVPLLGAAAWLLYTGKPRDALFQEFPEEMRLNLRGAVYMPTVEEKTSREGAFHFVHAASLFPAKGAFDVNLDDMDHDRLTKEERDNFKGGVALIGSTAVGAFDHYPSPFQEVVPGVIVHATIFDNLLKRDWLHDAPYWLGPLLALVLPWAAVGLIGLAPVTASLLAIGLLLALAGVDYGFLLHDMRFPVVAPALSFAATFATLMTERVWREGKEKRYIKNAFGQYLSPKVVNIIAANPSMLKLGGQKRDMSVFFLDIAHFTTISEKMTPEALTHFLNKYLTAFTNIILKNDGVVDKYIGDCIMAFWNAPLDQPIHRELACMTALECLDAIQRLNKELIGDEMPEQPAVRIGLNSGDAVVGNMGSETRLSYTVIGDTVNLASRLEGANKFFGTHLMASEDVFDPVKDKFEARQLGRVRVVGKAIPIRVYELWGRKGTLSPERKRALDLFGEGQELYYARQFEKAAGLFTQAKEAGGPDDKVSAIYLSAAQDFALLPPEKDWDGVFNLTAK